MKKGFNYNAMIENEEQLLEAIEEALSLFSRLAPLLSQIRRYTMLQEYKGNILRRLPASAFYRSLFSAKVYLEQKRPDSNKVSK